MHIINRMRFQKIINEHAGADPELNWPGTIKIIFLQMFLVCIYLGVYTKS